MKFFGGQSSSQDGHRVVTKQIISPRKSEGRLRSCLYFSALRGERAGARTRDLLIKRKFPTLARTRRYSSIINQNSCKSRR